MAGSFTPRVGMKFEDASLQQVWPAGGDTFTSSTPGQVAILSLEHTSGQDADLPLSPLREITPGWLGAAPGALV